MIQVNIILPFCNIYACNLPTKKILKIPATKKNYKTKGPPIILSDQIAASVFLSLSHRSSHRATPADISDCRRLLGGWGRALMLPLLSSPVSPACVRQLLQSREMATKRDWSLGCSISWTSALVGVRLTWPMVRLGKFPVSIGGVTRHEDHHTVPHTIGRCAWLTIIKLTLPRLCLLDASKCKLSGSS